jgi:hypothetical protein
LANAEASPLESEPSGTQLKPAFPDIRHFARGFFESCAHGPLRFRKVCQLCGEAPCDETLCPLRCFYPNKKSRERVRSRRLPGED